MKLAVRARAWSVFFALCALASSALVLEAGARWK